MTVLPLIAHLTALAALSLLTLRLARNLRFMRHVRRMTVLPDSPPRVSVLVPARNESAGIAACIESLAHQDYADYEIVALDDHSSDDTGAQLDALAGQSPHLTVLHGTDEPPAGWNGKSFACQRLADAATGDWLLFTDADTQHTPHSLAHGIARAAALEVDLLSVLPWQRTESWSERLMVSFVVDFLPLVGLALATTRHGRSSTAANGQYLLVRAEAYRASGGHRAIAGALVDDFSLAGQLRSQGYRTALVDGVDMLECRMYHSAREVWRGFSKNLWLALENTSGQNRPSGWIPLFMWAYACLFVLPFVFLFSAQEWLPALLTIIWLGLLRGSAGRHMQRPLEEIITTPLAAWGVMMLGLGALIRRWRRQPVEWKGRRYPATH